MNIEKRRLTGMSIPLGALRTKKQSVLGEFTTLIAFGKWVKKCGIGLIQLLPVNDTGTQSSPYSGLSAFALHPIYIDITALPEWTALATLPNEAKSFKKKFDEYVKRCSPASRERYDYEKVLNEKLALLRTLFDTVEREGTPILPNLQNEIDAWVKSNPWVVSYCVYKTLKEKYMQASWKEWKDEDKLLSQDEIKRRWGEKKYRKTCTFYAWLQMRSFEQFKLSSDAVRKMGIVLKGDMPILMNEDSADAWEHPEIFNQNLRAGSPVDDENPMGQNWGFPTYNWKYLKETNYDWWKSRLKVAENFYGAYRLDHVLGFFRIFALPTRDTTAMLGHTDPYVPITRDMLHNSGFDDNRIRWLSQPHIPTGVIENITWNHDNAVQILQKFATRIGNEELWLFRPSITGDKDIFETDIKCFCQGDSDVRVKKVLMNYWNDRCLIEIESVPEYQRSAFVPVWTYQRSTSWSSLSWDEKNKLQSLFHWAEDAQNKLWETQSSDILSNLTNSVKMTPCGEDLGAPLECLPRVLQNNGILSLRVYRWARNWKDKPTEPFIPLENLPELSVATASVHDSSTLRGWWGEDKNAVKLFVRTYHRDFGIEDWDGDKMNRVGESDYTPEDAIATLKILSRAKSVWCIHPLQDFLGMDARYWDKNPDNERVNIPGTVSLFNWTYKIPVTIEELSSDEKLIELVKQIARMHS